MSAHHRNRSKASKRPVESRFFGGRFFVVGVLSIAVLGVMALEYQLSSENFTGTLSASSVEDGMAVKGVSRDTETKVETKPEAKLDKKRYDALMLELANRPKRAEPESGTTSATSTKTVSTSSKKEIKKNYLWPPEDAPYPKPGAILPFKRVVAFYGNFYSDQMGILGKYSPEVVLAKLRKYVAKWERADPETPVVPAIDYIAITGQKLPGADGNYSLRMPESQIKKAVQLAKEVDGITILEVQPGQADLLTEVRSLENFLKKPKVHLAIDPEFHMRRGNPPGTWIGTVTASDVNKTIAYLSMLVRQHELPPKVLVVHRFTQKMIQNAEAIESTREVQVVIDMDGWGPKAQKKGTYRRFIYPEPVQFTGFKVFFENDTWDPSTGIMSPEEILDLRPEPIFIQYQ